MTYLTLLTIIHTLISLVALASGIMTIAALMKSQRPEGLIAVFLATTVATSVTGFMFPFHEFLPSHGVGTVALAVLAVTIPALYAFHLAGPWRLIFVIGTVISVYLNAFVFVAQLFLKVPPLHALAPTQSEPAFAIAQTAVLIGFVVVGVLAAKRFRQPAFTSGVMT